MRAIVLPVAVAALLVSAATAAIAAPQPALEPGTLDVAVARVSSGPFSLQRTQIERGARVAADLLNDAKGIGGKVVVRVRAEQTPVDAATAVVRRLAGQGIDALVLPCNVDGAEKLAAAAAEAGIVALAPCSPEGAPAGAWGVAMSGPAQAAQLVTYAAEQYVRTAFVVETTGSRRTAAITRSLRAAAAHLGIRIVGRATLDPSGRNAAEVARRIAGASPRPSAVLTGVAPELADALARALAARKVLAPVYGADGIDVATRFARYQEKNIYTSYGFARPEARAFERAYRDAYRTPPVGSLAGLGFEAVHILEEAVLAAGSARPAEIEAVLEKGLAVTGIALGDVRYPGEGARDPVASVGLVRILRGKAEPLRADVPAWIPSR